LRPPVLSSGPVSINLCCPPPVLAGFLSAEPTLAAPVLSGGPVSRNLCCIPQYWLVSCQQKQLWQSPVLSGGPVSSDISVAAPSTGWFPVSRNNSGSPQYCPAVLSAVTSLLQPPVLAGFPVWTQRLEENPLLLPGIEPRSPGCPVCSHTMLTELAPLPDCISLPVHNSFQEQPFGSIYSQRKRFWKQKFFNCNLGASHLP
jgi:hypothetical protein